MNAHSFEERVNRKEEDLIVVGIGASAGGLEALQEFFKAMPENSGLAFVVVQHLSPDYKSMMHELLSWYTKMPIHVISNGMRVEPNHIYLIPPRRNLRIKNNILYLENPNIKLGLNLPIDWFFRSLAEEKGKNAIGIILSGTGSDGTLGTRAIKEFGGMVMVQDDATAKFDGMPRSSIATGLVDFILPPSKMPEALLNYTKHPYIKEARTSELNDEQNLDVITRILLVLREYSGVDFSYYKENTVIRRIERRVSINRLNNLEEYLVLLRGSDREKEALHKELLIGVTRFFRDQEAFSSLFEKVIPEIISRKKGSNIRIWSVGCSTGEEAYSIAMLFQEYMSRNKINTNIRIFATDIDKKAIEIAGIGFYPDSMVADIEPSYLTKYFMKREGGYQVNETIRREIVFATHNILHDAPFSKIDLVICRNLLIYIKPDTQQHLLAVFHYSLSPDGYLFLGSSESIGEMDDSFTTIDSKWKIYRYKENFSPNKLKSLPIHHLPRHKTIETLYTGQPRNRGILKTEKLIESIISNFLPPSVLLDDNLNIIHVFNDVNKYLTIPSGHFTHNIIQLLPNEIALYVNNLLRRLKSEPSGEIKESLAGLELKKDLLLLIHGKLIQFNDTFFYLLSFVEEKEVRQPELHHSEVDLSEVTSKRIIELERELQLTKESLQATVEELETSNEELQASNEELIASNEELQSTNEELQSVNEELYTVNSEYQTKIAELKQLNTDLDNLLRNTEIAALYLDSNLCIRNITPMISKITNILPSDIGRPISHLAFANEYGDLVSDIDRVMNYLQPIDKEIFTKDGHCYLTKIRPYRLENNSIDGILVTFTEITKIKKLEEENYRLVERLNAAMKYSSLAWWEWDVATGKVVYDDKKATMLGYSPDEFPNDVYEICNLIHPSDYESTMDAMRQHLEGVKDRWEATYRIRKKDGTYSWYYDIGAISKRDSNGNPLKLVGTVIDISRIKSIEQELMEMRSIFSIFANNIHFAILVFDKGWRLIHLNNKSLDLFKLTRNDLSLTFDDFLFILDEKTNLTKQTWPINKVLFTELQCQFKDTSIQTHAILFSHDIGLDTECHTIFMFPKN